MEEHQLTERRACRLVGISRSCLAYQACPDRHARLRQRLITLSGKHRRYGYRMLHAKLVREGRGECDEGLEVSPGLLAI